MRSCFVVSYSRSGVFSGGLRGSLVLRFCRALITMHKIGLLGFCSKCKLAFNAKHFLVALKSGDITLLIGCLTRQCWRTHKCAANLNVRHMENIGDGN
jgi:hypothetical protein